MSMKLAFHKPVGSTGVRVARESPVLLELQVYEILVIFLVYHDLRTAEGTITFRQPFFHQVMKLAFFQTCTLKQC